MNVCKYCGNPCKAKFCSLHCCNSETGRIKSIKSKEVVELVQICKKCGKEFNLKLTNSELNRNEYTKYCSKYCSHVRILTYETKNKIRNKLIGVKTRPSPIKGARLIEYVKRKCKDINCNKIFECRPKSHNLYCSLECGKKNIGGYREKSGRSKNGYYKGIYSGSTYELAWIIYNLDHGISFKRFEGMLTDGELKYIPDFIQDDCIIEIKGYERDETVKRKTALATKLGYNIKVLYKKDIQYMIDYVCEKYSIKNKNKIYELYDDHKPKYSYTCSKCGKQYESNIIKNPYKNHCDRKCSNGRYEMPKIDNSIVIELNAKGLTTMEISKELNCSYQGVLGVINKLNLKSNRKYFTGKRKAKTPAP